MFDCQQLKNIYRKYLERSDDYSLAGFVTIEYEVHAILIKSSASPRIVSVPELQGLQKFIMIDERLTCYLFLIAGELFILYPEYPLDEMNRPRTPRLECFFIDKNIVDFRYHNGIFLCLHSSYRVIQYSLFDQIYNHGYPEGGRQFFGLEDLVHGELLESIFLIDEISCYIKLRTIDGDIELGYSCSFLDFSGNILVDILYEDYYLEDDFQGPRYVTSLGNYVSQDDQILNLQKQRASGADFLVLEEERLHDSITEFAEISPMKINIGLTSSGNLSILQELPYVQGNYDLRYVTALESFVEHVNLNATIIHLIVQNLRYVILVTISGEIIIFDIETGSIHRTTDLEEQGWIINPVGQENQTSPIKSGRY